MKWVSWSVCVVNLGLTWLVQMSMGSHLVEGGEHSRGKTKHWIMETLIQLVVRKGSGRGSWRRAMQVETGCWPAAERNRMVAEGQRGCQRSCQRGWSSGQCSSKNRHWNGSQEARRMPRLWKGFPAWRCTALRFRVARKVKPRGRGKPGERQQYNSRVLDYILIKEWGNVQQGRVRIHSDPDQLRCKIGVFSNCHRSGWESRRNQNLHQSLSQHICLVTIKKCCLHSFLDLEKGHRSSPFPSPTVSLWGPEMFTAETDVWPSAKKSILHCVGKSDGLPVADVLSFLSWNASHLHFNVFCYSFTPFLYFLSLSIW